MIRTVAVQGYRSLRDLLLPLGQLSVITDANGSGKSSVLSLATLARRCRAEFGRRFPRPRRWLAVDFLGGPEDHRASAPVVPPVEYLIQRGLQTVRLGTVNVTPTTCLAYP